MPSKRTSLVRRDLNASFESPTLAFDETPTLAYSIINSNVETENGLRMTLKSKENTKFDYPVVHPTKLDDAVVHEKRVHVADLQKVNNKIEFSPTTKGGLRRSTRNTNRKSYAEFTSPQFESPKKRLRKTSTDTPVSSRTPRQRVTRSNEINDNNIIEEEPEETLPSQSVKKTKESLLPKTPKTSNTDLRKNLLKSSSKQLVFEENDEVLITSKRRKSTGTSKKTPKNTPSARAKMIVKQLTGKTMPWEQAQTTLENKFVKSKTKSTLHAYNSVSMSENSIHLHSNIITKPNFTQESMLLSPTSIMCNMTSGLALNSPKKQRSLFNPEEVVNEIGTTDKLFPIFYEPNVTTLSTFKPTKIGPNCKKAKPLPKGQMFLDAGQKKFGATICPECNFMYHMGDPNEELIHLNYHNSGSVLRFGGWKDERVVSAMVNARIIRVLPSDPKPWLNKVKDLLNVINRDLGYYEMPIDLTNTQIFLYIKNKTIVGCLVAELKTTAYRLLNQDLEVDFCSELSYPVKCGVSRIWVLNNYRKQGVATSLLNSLRANFIFGGILAKEDIAFSSPTEMGKAFATKYFNTANFLVYTS